MSDVDEMVTPDDVEAAIEVEAREPDEKPEQCQVRPDCVAGLDHAGQCVDANGEGLGRPDGSLPGADIMLRAAPMDIPITPEVSELTRMAQLATTFAHAQLVPKELQGRPADVLLIMMTARSLGLDYPTGFRELYIVDGKVSMSSKTKVALARQRGYRIWPDPHNDEFSATWHGIRDGVTYSSTFDMDDAKRVEAWENGKKITLDQKSTYRQFPKRMLSHRASGYLVDDMCPEVAAGIYSPDELGAVTDAEGNVIDVSEVQPVVQSERDERKAEQAKAASEPAPAAETDALRRRIEVLPEDVKEEMRVQWKKAFGENTLIAGLNSKQLRRAKSMVSGFEAKARKGGWEPQTPQDDSPVAEDPEPDETQEAPEGPPQRSDLAAVVESVRELSDNEQRKRIAAVLAEICGDVAQADVEPFAEEVKAMSWQAVDKALAERGIGSVEGLHVDSRRMLLTGILVSERPMS